MACQFFIPYFYTGSSMFSQKMVSYIIKLGQRRKTQGCTENGNAILEIRRRGGDLKTDFLLIS